MNRYLLPIAILIILLGSVKAVGQLPLMPVRSKAVKLNQPSKPGAAPNQGPALGATIETPKLVPLAPTAAAVARYGDVQNNPNSGQINPSIPLYEIKLNDFSLPISLNYTSNGLKMNDVPGWVGMGWSINAVGTISRQVRSIPDEVTYGYNGYFPTALVASAIANGIYPNPGFQGMSKDQFLTQAGQFNFDLEPDMFFFNFGAYGGRFTFGANQTATSTKTATLIPMSDLKITGQFENSNSNSYNTANQQGTIDNFTATDPQGVRYEFTKTDGQTEHNLDDGFPRSVCRYNTWYLTHIFTPNGNKIEFFYTPRKITNPATISQRALIPLYLPQGAQSTNFLKSPQSDQAEVIDMVLNQILVNDGKDGQIQFTEQSNTRSDWNFTDQRQNAKPHALDKMTVRNGKGDVIHEYNFEYASTSRLMLRSVTERNGTSSLPPHVFTYLNETSLPAYVSPGANYFSEDYWGFYNQCSTDCDKFVPAYVYQTQPTTAVNITGSNKQPTLGGSSTGQLSQISYLAGGSTSFEYELNDYVAPATNTNICNGPYSLIGTALVDLATDHSEYYEGALKEVLITIPEGVNLQNVCLQVSYRIAIGGNPSNGVFARVGLYNSNGQAVFEPIPLRASINEPLGGISKTIITKANLTQQLRLVAEIYPDNALDVPNLINNQAEITVSMNQLAPGTMVTRNAGGVRIKRIRTCPNQASSSGCQLKTFNYTDSTGQSSGRLLSDLFFTTQAMKTLDAVGGGIPTVPITVLASTSPIAIVTSSGNHVYYEHISLQETDVNQTSNGGTRHQYISATLNPDIVFYANNDQGYISFSSTISQDWRRGKPMSISVVSAAGANLQETKSNYADKSYTYTGPAALKLGVSRYDKDDQPADYISFGYGLFTGFHYQQEAINTNFFYNSASSLNSATQLIQATIYSYNSPSHFFLTSTSTQNSKRETVETRLFYPSDLTSDTELGSSATSLLGVNKKSSVLKIETRTDNRLTLTQKTLYNSFSGKVLPSKTVQLTGTNTDGSSVDYKEYDSKGNVQEFTKNNGYPTTYLWGYNSSYPVAEIKNATYADVVNKGENLAQLTDITTDASITNLVASLRQKLSGALVQGFTYDLGYGINSTTDPSGLASYYVYDSFGRLLTIKNSKQETIKEYTYNYRDPNKSSGTSNDGNQSPYSSGTVGDQLATLNQPYTYTIPVSLFTDPESQNLTYTLTGLPTGLSFANGLISGTPSALGQTQVTLTATDPGGLSSSISFFLTISNCLVADPYIVTGTYSSSTPVSFNAVNRIETDAVQQVLVNPNASLILKAGESVRLKAGFTIKPGASFRAYTGPCN